MTPNRFRRLTAAGSTAEVGDIAVSSNCSGYSNLTTSETDVSNLTATLKTSGLSRVVVEMVPKQDSSATTYFRFDTGTGCWLYLYRNNVKIAAVSYASADTFDQYVQPNIRFVDSSPLAAGTHTYKLMAKGGGSSKGIYISDVHIEVFED
jgi:hypothetical protein